MICQLRFTESDSLAHWMEKTSTLLHGMVPAEVTEDAPLARERKERLKKALWRGLRSFVVRRSLCGSKPVCDEGCLPIVGNLNPKRYLELRSHIPVGRYLLEGSLGLSEAAERLAQAVVGEFHEALPSREKITRTLFEALEAHLYENVFCGREELCSYSKKLELPEDWGREEDRWKSFGRVPE